MNLSQSLIDSLPEPYIVLSRDLTCLVVNRGFADLVERSIEALTGARVDEFWPDVERACSYTGEHTVRFQLAQGKVITARLAARVSEVVVVRVLSSVAAGESAQLHHKQRLESLGLLAGGVAHDFNNVLTGILGHVAFLKHVLAGSEISRESLQAIEDGAIRASDLTQQILRFSKLDSADNSTAVDLGDLMDRVATLLKGSIPASISLKVNPLSAPFRVLACESHMTQILINLIVNARDAIADRGTIDVSFEPSCLREDVERLFGTEPASTSYGAISVRDDGIGMDETVKARLFEPYFTTKDSSGTGLGLATVHSIVEKLGGAIEVTSQLGAGTCFRIVLPRMADGDVEKVAASAGTRSVAHGSGERVLIIDDEYAVRNVLGLSLSHLGYEVETASSGLEGVEKFSSASKPFQLVILDLLMPGLSGEEVFVRLRALNENVPVLIVSGFSSEHVVQRILDEGGRDFIQKPFSIEVLAQKVRGCLRD